jgi:hypothetical protein
MRSENNGATHYEEGASTAHWQDQFYQEIYLQSIWTDQAIQGLGDKADEEFHWEVEQHRAFKETKEYLARPPVLVPPQQDRPFNIYLLVGDTSIALVVVQVYDGKEKLCFTSAGGC